MDIRREVLVDGMPGLYAVGEARLDGKLYYVAASEDRQGRAVLVDSETGRIHELTGGMGGVMAALPAGDGRLLFIEEFYPVFDSAAAKIIEVKLQDTEAGIIVSSRKERMQSPYVHRIGLLEEADGQYLAVGRLCLHKDCPEDWASSGQMEIAPLDQTGTDGICVVQDGLWKHHAMFISKNKEGYDDLFFGGTEGVFRTVRKNGSWETEKLLAMPTSDIVYTDLDGDGMEELAVIEQFHGNLAVVYKYTDGEWQRQIEIPLQFGHVLWGGSLLGEAALITGSRAGDKELVLYRFDTDEAGRLRIREETLIDEGQAPAQIMVVEHGDRAEVVAANHGAAQLVRYALHI